jgi:hypothetical protein
MKPVVLTVSIPATVLSCQVNASSDVVAAPDAAVPELKALNHYAGQWEDEIAGRPDVKRAETAEWVLRGRFLRQSWTSESPDEGPAASGLTLMTFDTDHKVYRSWAFLATGSVIENEGMWDPITKTFTWGRRLSESADTVITKASFPEDAVQNWSIVMTNERDQVVREVAGRSLRRALPALQAA